MATQKLLSDALPDELPHLRAFARIFHRDPARADDLVQEAVLKAWSNIDKFQEGTNLRAWLFTILRNVFLSEMRERKREVEDADGAFAAQLAQAPSQDSQMEYDDFLTALQKLSEEHREALILVGGSGFSYEEAAEICGCAVGTVKSRVNRARARLAELMHLDPSGVTSPDKEMMAALGRSGSTAA
ncbi:MAG: sigma-70 family RNA polymerase sigma factor [Neomegalonema sp.]|nr:sigma-70 family RNA polymerase sigma factor [Neomegalonema sp.]